MAQRFSSYEVNAQMNNFIPYKIGVMTYIFADLRLITRVKGTTPNQ